MNEQNENGRPMFVTKTRLHAVDYKSGYDVNLKLEIYLVNDCDI